MFEHEPIGRHLKLTVAGASHATALRGTLANFPSGVVIDAAELAAFMARRAPGRDDLSTARHEADAVEFLTGIVHGHTTGEPIRFRIANTDFRPHDYGAARTIPRPGHADFGQWVEQGQIPTGGGTNSGRLTAVSCAAGGLCLQELARRGIVVAASVESVGDGTMSCDEAIRSARAAGDSVGGTIVARVTGLRPGLGGALFAGVDSALSAALFGIPGVKGVEFGAGFALAQMRGSEADHRGGILGGRTNGEPLTFRVALKPTPTIFQPRPSIDLRTGESATCQMKGRHDPCIVRRAVPVVEALTAFVLLDLILATEAATPRICLTVTGATLEEDLQQLATQRLWTDLVELRADLLTTAARARVAEFPRRTGVPVLLTLRRKADGGAYEGPEAEREAFFRAALEQGRFAFVDFEADFRCAALEALARAKGTRIVRSIHCFTGPITDVAACGRKLVGDTGEIAKLAFRVDSLADVTRVFAETRDWTDTPHIVCAMGSVGRVTRVLAAETRSQWTYASVAGLSELGHLTPEELVRTYRCRTQGRGSELYGVTGWPLKVTRSPELHNDAFAREDIDARMVHIPAETIREALDFGRQLNLKGLAVTIPHKQAVMPLLDELTPEAQAIGAVNTVAWREGRLIGHNTDAEGFSTAVCGFLGRVRLDGVRAAVLGAGGASKAIVYALTHLGAQVEVFHRRPLTADFGLIVNATPVDPIPAYVFRGDEAVYDLVYEPAETPLLVRARAAGCRVENGLSMLVAQARAQRLFWGLPS